MTVEEKLNSLSDTELKVLAVLHMSGGSWFGYGNCYYPHNAIIAGEGQIYGSDWEKELGGKKGLSKILKKLRELGLANYMRGLMTEDGEVAGSGNAPDSSIEEYMEEICEKRGWL